MALSDVLGGLFGLGTESLLLNDAIQSAEAAGTQALNTAQNVASQYEDKAAFQPYTVTSGTGAVDALANQGRFAGLNLNLSPEQQAIVDALQGGAMSAAQMAGTDTGERVSTLAGQFGLDPGAARTEQEIFDLLDAVQNPARERERLALEERLFSQGRSGVRTAQFGGTPEELAIAKAREEARRSTAVDAFNLAREDEQRRFGNFSTLFGQVLQERGLGGDLASQFLSSSYLPSDDLRRTATLGADIGSISAQERIEAARLGAGLTESGLEGKIKSQELATSARIARNQQLADLLLGSTNEEGVNAGGLFNQILDLF